MKPFDIFNANTTTTGVAPWSSQIYHWDENQKIDIWGAANDDLVEIFRVLTSDSTPASTNNQNCGVTQSSPEKLVGMKPMKRCADGIEFNATLTAALSYLTLPAGAYMFKFSGSGFSLHTTRMTTQFTQSKACDCDCLPHPAVAPATATFTPCPAIFPMVWDFDGQTYASLAAWKAAISAFMGTTVGYTAPCTFTAPAGSVFPPLTLSAAPAPATLVLSPCPVVFPKAWAGNVYPNATAFAQAVSEYGTGWSYNISTCTITAPNGSAIPSVTAAPTASISSVPCPLLYPFVYSNATMTDAAQFDAKIEQLYGITVVVSGTSPCQVTQTSGAAGALPASIVVSAVPAPLAAALSVSKTTSSATAYLNQPHSFTINTANSAGDPANGAIVKDIFPAGFVVSSIAVTYGGGAGGAASATAPQMASGFVITTFPVGGTVSFLVSGQYTQVTTQTNVATIDPPNGVTNSTPQNSVTPSTGAGAPIVSVQNPPPASHDLRCVSKTPSNATPNVGDVITYTLVWENTGADAATGAKVADILPASLQAQSVTFVGLAGANPPATAPINDFTGSGVTIPNWPAGATVTATLTVQVMAAGTITNQYAVVIPPTATDPNPANNLANGTPITATAVSVPTTDLSITKTASLTSVQVGNPFSWTLNITNTGASANGATVTDAIPSEFTVNSISAAYGGGANGLTSFTSAQLASGAAIATLPSGGTVTIIITGSFSAVTTQTNQASVSAPSGVIDSTPANNSTPQTGVGAPTVVVLPPPLATTTISPCPATFPMVWDHNGVTYNAIGAFVSAYQSAMLPVVVTFTAPCTLSAPSGTTFIPTALSPVPAPCVLTLGVVQNNSIGARVFTFVDCPPSQRAAYDAAGFSMHNNSAGVFITMVRDTSGVECGINFTEPLNDSIGNLIGYLPY
jgi:uncharacterized repeat protein (TIGR01451 family)